MHTPFISRPAHASGVVGHRTAPGGAALATVLLLASTGTAQDKSPWARTPPDAPEMFRELADEIERLLRDSDLPSATVGIARDGVVLWEQAFGWADLEARVPATPDTPYALGSLPKAVVATGLMLLVQDGDIDLDSPIDKYLGDQALWSVTGEPHRPSVRQVADHTAGLPGIFWDHRFQGDELAPLSNADLIRRYGFLDRAPGLGYRYSNLGFAVLGHAIEVTSDSALEDFLRERLFEPLGMKHTHMGRDPEAPPRAVGYGPSPATIEYPSAPRGRILPHEIGPPAAGDVQSSLRDVLTFGLFHLEHGGDDVLRRDTREAMRVTGDRKWGTAVAWGFRTNRDGTLFVMHEGGSTGVRTRLTLVPEHDLVIAILTNRFNPAFDDIDARLVEWALPGESREWDWDQEEDAVPSPTSPTAEVPDGRWIGRIDPHGADLALEIEIRSAEEVGLRLGGEADHRLFRPVLGPGRLRGYALDVVLADVDWLRASATTLVLDLHLYDGTLRGTVLAQAVVDPERDCEYSVTHWVELRKS